VDRERRLIPGPDHFGTLLFFLLIAFLVSGRSDDVWPAVVGSAANLLALGAGFAATGISQHRSWIIGLAVFGAIGMVLVGAFDLDSIWFGIGALIQAVLLGAILAAVVRRVLTHEDVTLSTIVGVICAYVLIGMIFAWVFLALAGFRSVPVLEPPVDELPVYYSFVVLSTLGFGDVTPVEETAERLTAFEAMVGQIFLATVVARFVSMYGRPSSKA
jgi:hypothetical protein